MQKIGKFEFVGEEQFYQAMHEQYASSKQDAKLLYKALKLPKRATAGSAGYDVYAPFAFTLQPQETILLPTGIRVRMMKGWVLQIFPRSSLGFKYRLQCNNTVGIIDQDYYDSDNEGHIFVKLTNDSKENKVLCIEVGEALVQGIFLPFGICEDDDVSETRNGGFGSTNN